MSEVHDSLIARVKAKQNVSRAAKLFNAWNAAVIETMKINEEIAEVNEHLESLGIDPEYDPQYMALVEASARSYLRGVRIRKLYDKLP